MKRDLKFVEQTEEQFRNDAVIASAYFRGRPPVDDTVVASCARVLLGALKLTELGTDQIATAKAFFYDGRDLPEDGIAQTWYATLIELTNEDAAVRLLEGAGNLELPAGAAFTGCWLTPAGKDVAERLLREHPDWAKLLNDPA